MNDRQQIVRDHAGFSAAAIPGWLPLVLLPLVGFLVGYREPPWVLMWLVALAMFFGCKWLTWSQRPQPDTGFTRSMMFLFLWPGMDARAFCGSRHPGPVRFRSWVEAFAVTCLGVCLLWGVARWIPNPVLSGWVGLWGAVLLLHFGSFKMLSLAWQSSGIDAQPIMRAPLHSTSLAEFWGSRWNTAFHLLASDYVFKPLTRRIGPSPAAAMVFLLSGLVHELVISVPARGGYGLPTLYFLVQGAGVNLERSPLARRWGLSQGFRGWLFTILIVAGPALLLFHPWFITRVILPFMRVLRAT